MRIATYLFAVCALAMASVSQAAVTSLVFEKVEAGNIPGHQTFDLKVTGTGQFTGVQMLTNLTAGGFYQDAVGNNVAPTAALLGVIPTLRYDTFMSMGGTDSSTSTEVVIPGGAVNLGGAAGLTFSAAKIDATWAPPGASPVNNPNGHVVGRFTIADGTAGTIKSEGTIALLGLTFGEANYVAPIVDVAQLLGGIVVGPGVFESTPAAGTTLDFGYGPDTRTLQLATRNTAAPGNDDITVAQAVISGPNASLFSVPGFAQYNLVAGAAATNLGVQFNGIGTPGIYTATLNLLDEAGATLGSYTLTARVPEPSTIALAGLGLVGLVGFVRRRG